MTILKLKTGFTHLYIDHAHPQTEVDIMNVPFASNPNELINLFTYSNEAEPSYVNLGVMQFNQIT